MPLFEEQIRVRVVVEALDRGPVMEKIELSKALSTAASSTRVGGSRSKRALLRDRLGARALAARRTAGAPGRGRIALGGKPTSAMAILSTGQTGVYAMLDR